MKILTPPKKILAARALPSMQTLDKMMEQRINPEKDISLDVHADIVIRDVVTRKVVEKRRFRCESFVANFLKLLAGKFRQSAYSMTNIANIAHPASEILFFDRADFYAISDVESQFPFVGPVVGVGTTEPTPDDYQLEKQLVHGTLAENLSVETGTCSATSATNKIHEAGNAGWASDARRAYFVEITSGALQGVERYILGSIADNLHFYQGAPWNRAQYLPSEPDAMDYKIKTYGQLVHGTVGMTEPTDDGDLTSTLTITRTFTNSTGGNVDVTEYGLYVHMDREGTYSASSYLLIRDVAAPATIQNGQEMTLTYTFTVEA